MKKLISLTLALILINFTKAQDDFKGAVIIDGKMVAETDSIKCYNFKTFQIAFPLTEEMFNDDLIQFRFYNFLNRKPSVHEAAFYINGKLDGPKYEYYENVKVKTQMQYKNDLLNGEYKTFDEEGKLVAIQKFVNGEEVNAK